MKKTTFVNLCAAGLVLYLIITSYKGGAGSNGWDCTGAETGLGNPVGCTGAGCHAPSVTTGINITIELDSAGVSTTHYAGGKNYTVKLSGKNNTSNNLPGFGLQMVSIKGSAALTTPVNAGTWSTTCPPDCKFTAPQPGYFVLNMVEQSMPISATTGTGGNGTTYVETFTWTAPATGTGTISIWAAINAVNGDGVHDAGDKWNTNHVVINEWPSTSGIASVSENDEIKVFPNPVINNLALQLDNDRRGIYALSVYDLSGKKILSQNIEVNGLAQTENINTSNWAKGIYLLLIEKDGVRKPITVVKQ